jgi:assimilatory nitrate reductase catalytic subunit
VAPQAPALQDATSGDFPFRLNTGRVRDQWHTMTRTGASPTLAAHRPEPFVEIHPADGEVAGLHDGGFARVTTVHGACILKAVLSEAQQRGSLFAPIHWSGETASSARVGDLVAPHCDPISGQPEAKATPAAIAPVALRYRGFALGRRPIVLPAGTWWSKVAVHGGSGMLFASDDEPRVWHTRTEDLFAPGAELAEYVDLPRGIYRVAAFLEGRLDGCLFVGPAESASPWDAVKALLAAEAIEPFARRLLLSGRGTSGLRAPGPLICACFGVGLAAIRDAMSFGGASNVEDIGRSLRAGTNCGSCLPELRRILSSERVAQHA